MTKPRIAEPIKKLMAHRFRYKMSDSEFDHQLASMGWNEIGRGGYSGVYANKKKTYVLKISDRYDAGYEAYVKLIHNYKNVHFPRIGDIKKLRIAGKNYYVHLIEKLIEFPYRLGEQIAENIDDAIGVLEEVPRNKIDEQLKEYFGKAIPKYIANDPPMKEAIWLIANSPGSNWLDIHGGNFMKRKDGTIVITDPYS